jgi:hypothetical protein
MPLTIDDLPSAIRAAKRALRADLPGYATTFLELEGDIARQVDAIRRTHAHGRDAIPVLRFAEIANGAVEPRTIDAIRAHGAAVIRGVFDARQARDWNDEIGAYLEANRFAERLHARRRSLLRQPRVRQAADLRRLLVEAAGGRAPVAGADAGARVPEPVVASC